MRCDRYRRPRSAESIGHRFGGRFAVTDQLVRYGNEFGNCGIFGFHEDRIVPNDVVDRPDDLPPRSARATQDIDDRLEFAFLFAAALC